MNYRTFDLEDWISHINEAIKDERELDGNEMRDLVAFLSKMPRWIPVSESIPPFGQDVLVCDLDGDMYITHLHLNGTWGFEYCGNKIKNVVAWQELPLPYKVESEDEE